MTKKLLCLKQPLCAQRKPIVPAGVINRELIPGRGLGDENVGATPLDCAGGLTITEMGDKGEDIPHHP